MKARPVPIRSSGFAEACFKVQFAWKFDNEQKNLNSRQINFEITARCPETGARTGLLTTGHSRIETPCFMPVGTQATVKGIPQGILYDDLGLRIILANTYHLFLRPGHEAIERMGGLHRFMS